MQMMAPSPIIDAALSILADGKARTAEEILAEGRTRGLFDAAMTRKHVYTSLSQYIERAVGAGRKPELTEDIQLRFRINRAPDDWPNIDTTGLPALTASPVLAPDALAAIARAKRAEAGSDPTEYELAVCVLFSSIGFAATHVGGQAAPDGYADALLGPLSYRVMIECKLKTAGGIADSDAPPEAAKYKDGYSGNYCALVAPAFAGDVTFVSELTQHGVCAWTTDDLIRVLQNAVSPQDLRSLFAAPGFAVYNVDDLLWGRVHGPAKRLRVIASLILEEMLAQQRMAGKLQNSADAALFTVDVAIAAIDTRLADSGSSSGCAREEVQSAFEWLTNPLVRRAVWTDGSKTAIVRV